MFSTIQNSSGLPIELVDALNQTFFLHTLATDAAQVLPPGKSILSMLARPRTGVPQGEDNDKDSLGSLQRKVETLVHQAFWDEALESLSNPLPSSQISRLKFLYDDLRVTLAPIVPKDHPTLLALFSPLSPTPSPLHSALNHLRDILDCLRSRCAPVRDTYIDSLILRLDDPQSPLAKLVVDTIKAIIDLSSVMKDDLSQFVLGTMNEAQLHVVIMQQAMEDERKWVKKLWDEPTLRHRCQVWLSELELHGRETNDMKPRSRWILRLAQALSSTSPVSCSLPTSIIATPTSPTSVTAAPAITDPNVHLNILPPPFLFTAPSLLYIQNLLQALVVTASLRSLVRLPASKSHAQSPPSQNLEDQTMPGTTPRGSDFTQRIWTLLKLEIDEDTAPQSGHATGTSTKLINLADEVIRARRLRLEEEERIHLDSGPDAGPHVALVDKAEETRLRAAVDRTLRSHDPVFVLLQKRLMGAIAERLMSRSTKSGTTGKGAPEHLRTGHDMAKWPKWMAPSPADDWGSGDGDGDFVVKGFEDTVLVKGVGEALGKVKRCVGWMEAVWVDVIENEATTVSTTV